MNFDLSPDIAVALLLRSLRQTALRLLEANHVPDRRQVLPQRLYIYRLMAGNDLRRGLQISTARCDWNVHVHVHVRAPIDRPQVARRCLLGHSIVRPHPCRLLKSG